jgi:hypothetical protein
MEAYRAIRRATEPVAFPDVLDPAKVEPLSLVPSDVLRTYARQKGKPLIALIPDGLGMCLFLPARGHHTLQVYQEWFRRRQHGVARAGRCAIVQAALVILLVGA